MIDQAEMILHHFPGNDSLLAQSSMTDHMIKSITCSNLYANLYRVQNSSLT